MTGVQTCALPISVCPLFNPVLVKPRFPQKQIFAIPQIQRRQIRLVQRFGVLQFRYAVSFSEFPEQDPLRRSLTKLQLKPCYTPSHQKKKASKSCMFHSFSVPSLHSHFIAAIFVMTDILRYLELHLLRLCRLHIPQRSPLLTAQASSFP